MIFGLNAGKMGGGFIMLGLCMVVIDQIEFAFMAPHHPSPLWALELASATVLIPQ